MSDTAPVISAARVKELRDTTGLGMMECKKALQECAGDFDQARDLLRVKSGVKADKLSSRQATEGRIAFAESNGVGVLVEIGCETDFVARDDNLIAFATQVAEAVVATGGAPADVAEVKLADGQTVEEARRGIVMKLGENISVNRVNVLSAAGGKIATYTHMGDKIAAMCAYSGDDTIARDVCMHIAAMRPCYVERQRIPAEVISQEQDIFKAQAGETGKTAEMAEKIAVGKLAKYVSEVTLLEQPFVKDTDKKISEVLSASGTNITDFCLLVVGAN